MLKRDVDGQGNRLGRQRGYERESKGGDENTKEMVDELVQNAEVLELLRVQESLKCESQMRARELSVLREEFLESEYVFSTCNEDNFDHIQSSIEQSAVDVNGPVDEVMMQSLVLSYQEDMKETISRFRNRVNTLLCQEQRAKAVETAIDPKMKGLTKLQIEQFELQTAISKCDAEFRDETFLHNELSRLLRKQKECRATISAVLEKDRVKELVDLRELIEHLSSSTKMLHTINTLVKREENVSRMLHNHDTMLDGHFKELPKPSRSRRISSSGAIERLSEMHATKAVSDVESVDSMMRSIEYEKEDLLCSLLDLVESALSDLRKIYEEISSNLHTIKQMTVIEIEVQKSNENTQDLMLQRYYSMVDYRKHLEKVKYEIEARDLTPTRVVTCAYDDIIRKYLCAAERGVVAQRSLVEEILEVGIDNDKNPNIEERCEQKESSSLEAELPLEVEDTKQNNARAGKIIIKLICCSFDVNDTSKNYDYYIQFSTCYQTVQSKIRKIGNAVRNETLNELKWDGNDKIRCRILTSNPTTKLFELASVLNVALTEYDLSKNCIVNVDLSPLIPSGHICMAITYRIMGEKDSKKLLHTMESIAIEETRIQRHRVVLLTERMEKMCSSSGVSLGAYFAVFRKYATGCQYIDHKFILSEERADLLRGLFLLECIINSMRRSENSDDRKLFIDSAHVLGESFAKRCIQEINHIKDLLHFDEMNILNGKIRVVAHEILYETMNSIGSFCISQRSTRIFLLVIANTLAIAQILCQSNDDTKQYVALMESTVLDNFSEDTLRIVNDEISVNNFFDVSIPRVSNRLLNVFAKYGKGHAWYTSLIEELTKLESNHLQCNIIDEGGNARLRHYYSNLEQMDDGKLRRYSSLHSTFQQQSIIFLILESQLIEIGGAESPLHQARLDYTILRKNLSPTVFRKTLFAQCASEILPAIVIVSLIRRSMDAKVRYTDISERISRGTSDTLDLQFMFNRVVRIPDGARKYSPSPRKIEVKSKNLDIPSQTLRGRDEILHSRYINRNVEQLIQLCGTIKGMLDEAADPESSCGIFKLPEYLRYALDDYVKKLSDAASNGNYDAIYTLVSDFDDCITEIINALKTAQIVVGDLSRPLQRQLRVYEKELSNLAWTECGLSADISEYQQYCDEILSMIDLIDSQLYLKISEYEGKTFPLSEQLIHALLDPEKNSTFLQGLPNSNNFRRLEPYLREIEEPGHQSRSSKSVKQSEHQIPSLRLSPNNKVVRVVDDKTGAIDVMEDDKKNMMPQSLIDIQKAGKFTVPEAFRLSESNRKHRSNISFDDVVNKLVFTRNSLT